MFWFHILLTLFFRIRFHGYWNFDLQANFELKCFYCCLFSVSFFFLSSFPVSTSPDSLVLWLSLHLAPWNSVSEPDSIKAVQGSWPWWCQRYLRSNHQANMWLGSFPAFKVGSVSSHLPSYLDSPNSKLRQFLAKSMILIEVPCPKWSRLPVTQPSPPNSGPGDWWVHGFSLTHSLVFCCFFAHPWRQQSFFSPLNSAMLFLFSFS